MKFSLFVSQLLLRRLHDSRVISKETRGKGKIRTFSATFRNHEVLRDSPFSSLLPSFSASVTRASLSDNNTSTLASARLDQLESHLKSNPPPSPTVTTTTQSNMSTQQAKITVHWLDQSRAQRVLWLLEEVSFISLVSSLPRSIAADNRSHG